MAVSTKILILVFALWALYTFARRLDLGRGTCIRDDDHARQIAQNELIGFIGRQVLIDYSGQSALVRGGGDGDGAGGESGADNYVYIRKHGAHFVTHMINGTSIIQENDDQVILQHSDLPGGAAILQITISDQTFQLAKMPG